MKDTFGEDAGDVARYRSCVMTAFVTTLTITPTRKQRQSYSFSSSHFYSHSHVYRTEILASASKGGDRSRRIGGRKAPGRSWRATRGQEKDI
jgi:hypothetical protein